MQLITDEKQKEVKSHGNFSFPLFVSHEVLSHYERGSFLWHWHTEIEFTFVTEGEMIYQINQEIYHIHAGQGLFCNSNALHTGHMINGQDCRYISLTFHPRLLYGYEGSILQQNYVKPLIESISSGSFHFLPDSLWQKEILKNIKEISDLYVSKEEFFELQIQMKLYSILLLFFKNQKAEGSLSNKNNTASRNIERLRAILSYLQEHYMEKITLEDIAKEIGLCESECCRFFKKQMNQSLFDYILYYRIEKSLPLLTENKLSITEISEQTGFSSPSYYARIFKAQLGCSPSQYQKETAEKDRI